MLHLRKYKLWLVKKEEAKIFILLSLLLLLFSLNHDILHNLKDTLIVSYLGPEYISLFKAVIVLPGSVAAFALYSKLSFHYSQKIILFGFLSTISVFLLTFSFIIFPILHPYPGIAGTKNTIYNLPQFWDIAIFYLFSELWGNLALGVLFWGFMNRTFKFSVAKRFYTPLNLVTAAASIVGGVLSSSFGAFALTHQLEYSVSLQVFSIFIGTANFLAFIFYNQILKTIEAYPKLLQINQKAVRDKKESLLSSLQLVGSSKFLRFTGITVICFALSFNLVEVIWKFHIREMYQNQNQYSRFIAHTSIIQGLISAVVIFISSGAIVWLGWLRSALFTPIAVGISGLAFFVVTAFLDYFNHDSYLLLWSIYLGTAHFVTVRTCRLAFFEPTKEMAYIPQKNSVIILQGKAAVDLIGDRLGRGGGSLLQYLVIGIVGGVVAFIPYAFIASTICISIWIHAVYNLSKILKQRSEPT